MKNVLFQTEKFQENAQMLLKEMKIKLLESYVYFMPSYILKQMIKNKLCLLVSQGSYSKTGDSLEKGKPWKKNVKKTKNRTNLFYRTYWQEENNWQIRSMKISFLSYRTLCFKIHVHQLFHFLILFYFLKTSWRFDSCTLYLHGEAFYFVISSTQIQRNYF